MSKLLNALLLFFAALMIAAVGFGDPGAISQKVNDFFGWKPNKPVDAHIVNVQQAAEIRNLVARISEEDVAAEIERFAAFGSRVPGYPGERQAYEYVRQRFEELGLENIESEGFKVAVPIDRGAELVVEGGKRKQLYSLWPNGVRTSSLPEGGIDGGLIYGGAGELTALDGQQVEGSVVLLDFACGQNYLNPASLGAKAIVFYDNGGVNREQAADKFLKVSVDIPRFWIERDDALELIADLESRPLDVHLNARMDWQGVEAHSSAESPTSHCSSSS